MKRTIVIITLSVTAVLSVNCGHSPESLSTKSIVKQVNEKMQNEASTHYLAKVSTGTYECNDEIQRAKLKDLSSAGLINYSVDRYAWWEKCKKA